MGSGWKDSDRRQRLPKDWSARRHTVLLRDQGFCYICGQQGATEVDHIVAGDDHSLGNLAAVHKDPCHAQKTAREGNAAKRPRRRPVERHPGEIT